MTTIWDLKRGPWSDEPRYHPPGQHPANYRDRMILRKLEELPPSVERDEAIAYCKDRITSFEEAESECKARDHLILQDRRPRTG